VNNYALSRQTLLLQGISFSEIPMDVLVRWLVLESHFPILTENLLADPEIFLSQDRTDNNITGILQSKEFQEISAGKLSIEKIRILAGK
jgi:hypothetical protein